MPTAPSELGMFPSRVAVASETGHFPMKTAMGWVLLVCPL